MKNLDEMKSLDDQVLTQWNDGIKNIVPGAKGIMGVMPILRSSDLNAFLGPKGRQYVTGFARAAYEMGQARAKVGINELSSPVFGEGLAKNMFLSTSRLDVYEIEKAMKLQFRYVPFEYEISDQVTVSASVGKLLGTIAARLYYIGMAGTFNDSGNPDMARRAKEIAKNIEGRYSTGDVGIVPSLQSRTVW